MLESLWTAPVSWRRRRLLPLSAGDVSLSALSSKLDRIAYGIFPLLEPGYASNEDDVGRVQKVASPRASAQGNGTCELLGFIHGHEHGGGLGSSKVPRPEHVQLTLRFRAWLTASVGRQGEYGMRDTLKTTWDAGGPYERFVGRWSRLVASAFLAWLAVPAGRSWADVGCGTGALTESILTQCAPTTVIGIDRSEGFLAEARHHTTDARVRFLVGDATALPLDAATCDVTASGLVLHFVADPPTMVHEMIRVTKLGGTVAAYVWDYAGGMEMLRCFWDAAVAVTPQDTHLDQAERFPLCQPAPLTRLWQDLGLKAVTVRAMTIPTVFHDFDDYWTPFLGKQGAAPTYLAAVDTETQEQIRAVLQSRLGSGPDGTIALTARAWAIQGLV